MEIKFTERSSSKPKNTNRSRRLRKKLCVGEFALLGFKVVFDVPLFGLGDESVEDSALDVMYEHDLGICICGDEKGFSLLTCFDDYPSNPEQAITAYVTKLVLDLKNNNDIFKTIQQLDVEYYDATYGDFE